MIPEDKDNMIFDELFEKFYPGLLFYATQFLDESEAKDVVQDAFLELWKRKDTIVVGERIQSYLYRLVYTRSINVINHKKIASKYSDAMIELYNHKIKFYESKENNDIILRLENQEINKEIADAINKLPEKCKEVFKMSYLHELKNKEIAEVMDISLRTVEAHMYKALKILRSELRHLMTYLIFFMLFF